MLRAPCHRLLSALLVLPLLVGLALVPSVAAHATPPGPNGRIAFDDFMTGEIYAVNPDGTALVQLTHLADGHFAAWPDWSPSGENIAFASDKSGQLRLWIMDADGGHPHMVAADRNGMDDLTPSYTPDGSRLLFTRCRPDPPGGCALFSVRTDGSDRHAITSFRLDDVVDFGSSVAPRSGKIAFARFNANGITSQVYVMRGDGSGVHALTAPALEGFAPDWSPDGRRITFSSDCCRLGSNVYSMNADGTGLRHLTHSDFPNNDLASVFSPRGDRIAFISDRRYDDFCCADLFVMRTDGTTEAFIDTGLTGVENPAWGSAPLIAPGSSVATTGVSTPTSSRVGRGTSARCWALPALLRAKERCA